MLILGAKSAGLLTEENKYLKDIWTFSSLELSLSRKQYWEERIKWNIQTVSFINGYGPQEDESDEIQEGFSIELIKKRKAPKWSKWSV